MSNEKKERPILFSGEMVRAILDGRKTKTRRVVKADSAGRVRIPNRGSYINLTDEGLVWSPVGGMPREQWVECDPRHDGCVACPYGKPGDLLWVRETFAGFERPHPEYGDCDQLEGPPTTWPDYGATAADIVYRADGKNFPSKWHPAIHMPRWASRISLEVTGVRVERLQDISEEDARAEGVKPDEESSLYTYRDAFSFLWESLNAARGYSWESNPFVWVVEFRRAQG